MVPQPTRLHLENKQRFEALVKKQDQLSDDFTKIGARCPIVEEPISCGESYRIGWREPRLDLAELAVLRWIDGLSVKELVRFFAASGRFRMKSIDKRRRKMRLAESHY